jgi:hypothetical protein
MKIRSNIKKQTVKFFDASFSAYLTELNRNHRLTTNSDIFECAGLDDFL